MEASNSFERPGDIPLDILGQHQRINRLYTQITLCFSTPEDPPSLQTRLDGITDTLSQGLSQLSTAFTWTRGTVVREHGEFKIKLAEPPFHPRFRINDLRGNPSFRTWDALNRKYFPFGMLDEELIAPCKTMVSAGEELPVLLVQANFIEGGLLLTINAQHGSMDMRGQGQISHLLAKACRGEAFAAEEVEVGNLHRKNHIPLLEEVVDDEHTHPGKDTSQEKYETPAQDARGSTGTTAISQPHLVWAYLAFPASSLSSLKALATKSLPPDKFVSTDDVLTAFIWQAITRARQTHLQQDGHGSSPAATLTRNVDVRRHFDLPSTYPGLVTTATSHTYPVDELVANGDLGSIASSLRAALGRDSLIYNARLQATNISRDRDAAGKKSIAATSTPSLDVRVSSWAKEEFYNLDFGPLLGKPRVVRRPRFVDGAREGLVYFLPKDREGEIVVGVCLRIGDLERLKADEVFKGWWRWIG
ncbi:hypothetical protein G7046_g6747 [Stylonectria norvegica]|nr:hypothetical protein G7046_g6747 [Stylonectria norvegica]